VRRRRNLASENAGGGDGGTARRSLLCRLGWSYRDAAGVTVAAVATGAILVNTLFLQSGPHPAPIFGSKSAASAANEIKDAAVGALPRSRESAPVKGDFAGLKKAEPSKSDPPAKTEPPGASRVASDVISDIQRELTRRAFYDGTIDGLPGPRTTSAIRDFEQAAGLKPGAEPNAALLRAIRSANAKVAKATAAAIAPARPAPSPPPARTDPINDVLAPSKRVVAVQRALADYGYGQIRPTGMLDRETKAAIERFERERKLPVTGAASERVARELAAVTGRPLE
jgi:peptidoglycan hydrolase-like protein with peptidoglycan-binding domain